MQVTEELNTDEPCKHLNVDIQPSACCRYCAYCETLIAASSLTLAFACELQLGIPIRGTNATSLMFKVCLVTTLNLLCPYLSHLS